MKTKFEELWSLIMYTDTYDQSKIRFWYLNEQQLDPIAFSEILKKQEGMIVIRKNSDDIFLTEIPVYRIYVITFGTEILMDRRKGNYQVENLDFDLSFLS